MCDGLDEPPEADPKCVQAHEDGHGFKVYDGDYPGYFTESYKERHANWPTKCCKCDKVFVEKKQSECSETEYSIREKGNGACLCPRAALTWHECKVAYCKQCKLEKFGGSPNKRERKKKRISDPTSD